ncbi:MAG: RNA-directed DNA polymerase [Alcanivoracaceae bacterium]|nr:RNA-directed DNA polymerase [Alcanivoracaceae bacterium]
MTPPKFYYHGRPIAKLNSLAASLGIDRSELLRIAKDPGRHYFQNAPILKSDGSERITFRLSDDLSLIQKNICRNFFHTTEFPAYLHGGIKDEDYPRSILSNAKLHLGSKLALKDDIKNFYPSISGKLVFQVWQRFYGFSPEISEILTSLCVHDDMVPQGSNTATYLANLCMFDREPEVVDLLEQRGFRYSRYIDDIHISSRSYVSQNDLTWACTQLYGLLAGFGFKAHRKAPKHVLSRNPKNRLINNQRVIGDRVVLEKRYRKQVRDDVRYLVRLAQGGTPEGKEVKVLLDSTIGKIGHLRRYHPEIAEKLKAQLRSVRLIK